MTVTTYVLNSVKIWILHRAACRKKYEQDQLSTADSRDSSCSASEWMWLKFNHRKVLCIVDDKIKDNSVL
jgi:hypothetical protein